MYMNQEQNNFNTQGNNGIPNNQPLNNQEMMNQQFGGAVSNNNQYNQNNFVQSTPNRIQSEFNPNQVNLNPNMQSSVNQTAFQTPNSQEFNTYPQPNISYTNQPQMNQNLINDEELLKEFIGNNYEKITTRPFNVAGFFFTTFYMFYRKMFLYALLLFLVNLVVLNVINNFIVTLGFNILVGFFVNKIYLFYAKKKVSKIKQGNIQKGITEIKKICSTKGGTSIGQMFLGFFIEVVITIIILLIMAAIGLTSVFGNLFSTLGEGIKDGVSGTNETYNGVMMFDNSIIISDEFSITVPNVFEDDSDEYEYDYEYNSGQGVFRSCSITFNIPDGYSSAENLINQMAKYNLDNNPTEVEKINLNNIDWYWFSYNDAFGTTYYYGTTKNNKVYLLEYSIQEDAPSDCINYKQQVLNSIIKK